jgi:hypothetical protein
VVRYRAIESIMGSTAVMACLAVFTSSIPSVGIDYAWGEHRLGYGLGGSSQILGRAAS